MGTRARQIGIAAFVLGLLLWLHGPLALTTPGASLAAGGQRIGNLRWGYYVAYDPTSFASFQAHVDSLDYLSPYWYSLEAGGALTPLEDPNRSNVIALARSHGVRLLPMVKNTATGGALHPILADPGTRQQTVNRLVQMVVGQNFDGINVDFENVDASDRPYLTTFMAALAPALRAQGKIVSQAVAAKDQEKLTGWTGAYDYAGLGPHNDFIVVMAYGYYSSSSSTSGSTSPYSWVDGTAAYITSQVPSSKIIMGIGFWGYDWNKTAGGTAAALRYDQVEALIHDTGATAEFDETTQSAHFTYWRSGQQHEVWYENRRAVETKLEIVSKYALGGAAGWRIGHEDPAVWQSFDALLGFRSWYLAEGSTAKPYETWILIQNPNPEATHTRVTFMTESGNTVVKEYDLAPTSRFSIFANQVVPNTAFSTRVEANRAVLVERAMYFGYDGHDSVGASLPAYTWYLPEGYTGSWADTWVLLMNPNDAPAQATVTFLKENGQTVVRTFQLAPTSRLNVFANQIVPNAAISTMVKSDLPIVAERAMYFSGGKGGHGSMGMPYTARTWYNAEGYSKDFDTWLLLLNPNPNPVQATLTVMKENGGTLQRTYTLLPTSRFSIFMNEIAPAASFSTRIDTDKPIVVERSMYWNHERGRAGHSAMGMTASAPTWYLPEGSTGYPFQEWALLMNPNTSWLNVNATYMKEGGATVARSYQIPPLSRFSINVNDMVPNSAVSVRFDGDGPIAVERSMYFRGGGTNSTGIQQ